MIEFTRIGKPFGKERPRFFRGHAFTPNRTREVEKEIKALCEEAMKDGGSAAEKYTTPVQLTVRIGVPNLKKNNGVGDGRPNQSKPDLDNIVKLVMDACNGVAYSDDGQVSVIVATKLTVPYGDDGYTEVHIEPDRRMIIWETC